MNYHWLIVMNIANNPRRGTKSHLLLWDIFCDNRTSANNRLSANGHTRQ